MKINLMNENQSTGNEKEEKVLKDEKQQTGLLPISIPAILK